jgi:hypothetical protein
MNKDENSPACPLTLRNESSSENENPFGDQ